MEIIVHIDFQQNQENISKNPGSKKEI